MKPEVYKFIVPTWSLAYIFNSDNSGLTSNEINLIEEKLSGFTCFSCDSNTFFSHTNDIDNLGSECTVLTALKYNNSNN